MPGRPRFRRATLCAAVVLAALSTAVGCGGDDGASPDATRLDDIDAVGTATLFPGTGEEEAEDINFPSAAVGEPAAVDVEVRNTTDRPMKVNDVAANGVEVSDDKCSGETVPSGESCTFRMIKQPGDETDDTDGTGDQDMDVTVATDQGSVTSELNIESVENGDEEITPDEPLPPTDGPPPDVPTEPTDEPAEPTDVPTEPTDAPTGRTEPPEDVPTGPTDGPEDGLPDSPGTT
ncbi:hypothetical protein [Streptomyces sp. NPDC002851]